MHSPKLKTCPHCGSTNVGALYHIIDEMHYVCCNDCHMRGPEKKYKAIAQRAWQALPRQPKWTSESPTKPGWYFTRRNRPGKPLRVVYVKKEKRYDHRVKEERELMTMAEIRSEMGYIIEELNQDDRQWAGPIPEPREVEDD